MRSPRRITQILAEQDDRWSQRRFGVEIRYVALEQAFSIPEQHGVPLGKVDVLARQAAHFEDPATSTRAEAAPARVTEYEAQISRYRASLGAGGDPAVIGPWIAQTRPGRGRCAELLLRAGYRRHRDLAHCGPA